MDLILWRHAQAEAKQPGQSAEDDLARALTRKGAKQADRMADWLNQRLVNSTRVIVSPALRCQQTAKALGRKFRTVDEIGPDAGVLEILRAARWLHGDKPVLVVGHQPTLGAVAAQVLTGAEFHWPIKLAAVWWIRQRSQDEGGDVLLQAVQSPDGL